jgi:hypothetical protein
MKYILDVEEQDMGQALGAISQVRTQNPQQEIGKEFGVRTMVNGKEFIVVRNLNSYTIREPY